MLGAFLDPRNNSTISKETYVNFWLLQGIWFLKMCLKRPTLISLFPNYFPFEGRRTQRHTDRRLPKSIQKSLLEHSARMN